MSKHDTSTPETGKPPRRGRSKPYYAGNATSLAPESNIAHLLKQLQSSMNRSMDQLMAPLGLTAMQWRPLALIRYRGVNTPAELSRHSYIDTGAMTRTLDRLEAKGFLGRHRSPEDRRVVQVELTQAGMEVAEQILPAVAATLNAHLQGFSKTEVDTLIDFLNRMLINGGGFIEDGCPFGDYKGKQNT
ncbi:MarR family transcriptional regulator [Allopusillimonas soli]|uniref:MarR family transcriptional regulator n=1 Tax=Allopusillimonas soli TaxID=659016 RepID=A0A853F4Z3_9BURK|nr:MarR family transcriptional regulator [Allopusillimonas soli]NYT35565.1 MarR family transcriptional regulator [Allopusillimonas soli]TEA75968.1 MarR family transcriptional regulator [Allopusillimonas soli]